MRRVRGRPVGGKSETGHGRGQTIMRSIEDDIQTEEYRGFRLRNTEVTEATYTR